MLKSKTLTRLRALSQYLRRAILEFSVFNEMPAPSGSQTRAQVLNRLLSALGATDYLEIGVNTPLQPGYSRDQILVQTKHGVDPNPDTQADFVMTSDYFFATNTGAKYDLIFIDGLHTFEQAYKDILNSLKLIKSRGIVVVHDTRPTSKYSASRRHGLVNKWHGDVWRAIVLLRFTHPFLAITTLDTDEGLTIIEPGTTSLNEIGAIDGNPFSWESFKRHYRELLGLIDEAEFESEMLPRIEGTN